MMRLFPGLVVGIMFAAVFHFAMAARDLADLMVFLTGNLSDFQLLLLYSSEAPRIAMAILVGLAMGLAGAVFQEVTQNNLASPTTLGTAAGAWLFLVVANIFFPALAATYGVAIAMFGGLLSTAMVLILAGTLRFSGTVIVVIGMAMNLFLGGVATIFVLLQGEALAGLFVWGAGDLTQTGWAEFIALAPQVLIAAVGLVVLARSLSLLRLGSVVANSAGLNSAIITMLCLVLAVWLTAATIAPVGVIGFIGLIAPNIARFAGCRKTLELYAGSALFGALALLATDILPIALSGWAKTLIPSGSSAALFGALGLIFLVRRQGISADRAAFRSVGRKQKKISNLFFLAAAGLIAALACVAVFVSRDVSGIQFGIPSELAFQLRAPRVLVAVAAGISMAVCGLLLQRLLGNPLASPDVVGITSGAALAVVIIVVFLGLPLAPWGTVAAFAGASLALTAIVALGVRTNYSPSHTILMGISFAAILDALMNFALARGGDEAYMLLGWLAGSTFLVGWWQAVILLVIAITGLVGIFALRRWMELLSIGQVVASSNGLNTNAASTILLCLVALLTSAVTAFVGPISFVGLIAPHIAFALGARRFEQQLFLSAAIGGFLFAISDLVGRIMMFPAQMPAGVLVALVGGFYLFGLIAVTGRQRPIAS